ncbi:MAG: hypothetical protein ACYDDF_04900 [Thermoplasmatota archaeon]
MEAPLERLRERLIEDYEGGGQWVNQLGDAIAFAPAFLSTRDALTREEARAYEETEARARKLLMGMGTLTPPDEAGLGALGITAAARAGNRSARTFIRTALSAGNTFALAQRGYLTRPASSHGPTCATLGLAYLNLYLASGMRGPARVVHGRAGEWLIRSADSAAGEPKDGYFRAAPRDRSLKAEPNLLAIATLARAARIRNSRKLSNRAEAVEAILRTSLFDGETGFFLSSEKAEPDFELPIQNLAILAYAELGRAIPRGPYLDRGNSLLANTLRRFARGRVLSHTWNAEKGAGAWHCCGCCYQTLWVTSVLRHDRARGAER